jgi:hypothetical protein
MEYLVVKWLHVLSSTVLFGTGLGSAFYMFFTNRTGEVRAIAIVARRVVIADWLFTTPTAIVQPLTGFYLMHLAGMSWTTPWILWSLVLYVIAGACWVPVVWIQNLPVLGDCDGDPDCAPQVYVLSDAIDTLLSQAQRGVVANNDPVAVVADDAHGKPRRSATAAPAKADWSTTITSGTNASTAACTPGSIWCARGTRIWSRMSVSPAAPPVLLLTSPR